MPGKPLGSIVIKGVGLFLPLPPAIPEADDGTEQLVFCSHTTQLE